MKDDIKSSVVAVYGRIGKSKNTQALSVDELEQQLQAIEGQQRSMVMKEYYRRKRM